MVDFGVRTISLTRGMTALVDEQDFERLSLHSWCADYSNRTRSDLMYAHSRINCKKVYMHRLIIGAKQGELVDHENGNGLDNRRCNLRICGYSGNQANSRRRVGVTSRYKGVHWLARASKWKAVVVLNKRAFYLGLFNSEEEAGRAYDQAALRLFGAFARLNFPEPSHAS